MKPVEGPPPGMMRSKKAGRLFALPFVLTLLFLALTLLPRIGANRNLVTVFVAVGIALLAWQVVFFVRMHRSGRTVELEFVPIKSHYVQASVQFCVYAYWGWYWRQVYDEAPLIVSQILFLYVFDMLLSWSRGRRWRLGFGPLPIIFSTNLFMWFKDDWFIFQFVMVAVGALGKEFIRWQRDGKTVHIFNPSAFGLSLVSVVLILTGTTNYTWGQELAEILATPPHIYLQIFLLGLIVQYFFSVTLMTLSAAAVLCLLNLIYTGTTGVYHFIDSNIPVAVFLGLHLLVTDPSTSPRTNLGRVIFGALYGLGVWVLYGVLGHFGVPEFYDKLLPVPLLNLSVRLIDRFARSQALAWLATWEAAWTPRRLNLLHMGLWIALGITMLGTGFIEGKHEGNSIAFWKKAVEDGKPNAEAKLLRALSYHARNGSGAACNELGVLYASGRLIKQDSALAAELFAKACELGDAGGCANVAIQFLSYGFARSEEDVARALAHLEQAATTPTPDSRSCYLIGLAYETGRGRPMDKPRSRELYARAAELGDLSAAKSLAAMRLHGEGGPVDLKGAADALEVAGKAGDAESYFKLAVMYHNGAGVSRNEEQAIALLRRAADLGSADARQVLQGITGPSVNPPANQ